MSRTSRLWRKMGATEPIFRLWGEDGLGPINDHGLKSVTINRGSARPQYGLTTDTLEVETALTLGVHSGGRVHFDLTDYGADLIEQWSFAQPAKTAPRFYGRVGKMTMNDVRSDRQHATVYAASWFAQLSNTTVPMLIPANTPVRDAARQISAPAGVGLPWVPVLEWVSPQASYGYVYADMEVSGFDDGMGKLVSDLGIYGWVRRGGDGVIMTPAHMWEQAQLKMPSAFPLTRSQAISPATWEQPVENIAGSHWVSFRDETAAIRTRGYGDDPNNPNLRRVDYDMEHVRWSNDYTQPYTTAQVGYFRERDTGYAIPSLTVDLLYLLTSPVDYHRLQARQLLELEVGDPVFLSGDWNRPVRGINFATGLKEQITPDRWELTISLHPSDTVVGEQSPVVPARVWESADWPWDDETREWNGA